jgi:hypothetical protein
LFHCASEIRSEPFASPANLPRTGEHPILTPFRQMEVSLFCTLIVKARVLIHSNSNFGDEIIGVGVGIGIGIDKTTGISTPIPIPTPTPIIAAHPYG